MHLPPYSNYPIVTGDKVTLREILIDDINDIIAISYYDGIQATSLEQACAMQVQIKEDYLSGDSIHWGIFDTESNQIVGTCGYYRGFKESAGELGCVLLPQHYKKGYMTIAMQLAIEYGIHTMGLKRIYAITNQENSNAIHLLERLKFVQTNKLEDNYLEFDLTQNQR